VLCAV